jgi:hypothetical protein
MVLLDLIPAVNDRVYEFGLSEPDDSGARNHCGCANQPPTDSETLEIRERVPALSEQKGRRRASRLLPSGGRRRGVGISAGLMKPSPAATPWESPRRREGDGAVATAVGPSLRGSLTISRTSAAVRAVPTQNLGKCQIPLHQRIEFWRGPEPNLAWLAHRMGTEGICM